MAQGQLLRMGTVRGFAAGRPDIAIISNGQHTVYAYISGNSSAVKIGQTYQVYKQDNLYFVGSRMAGNGS